jgi:hypothetical protein
MRPKILVVNGHPDQSPSRFCAALSRSYVQGAQRAGAATMLIDMRCVPGGDGALGLELRDAIASADRMAFIFPLWTSDAPPMLHRFVELTLNGAPVISLRTVVTMDLPSLFYRGKTGFAPLRGVKSEAWKFIGSMGSLSQEDRERTLADVARSGEADGLRIARLHRRFSLRDVLSRSRATAIRSEPRFA